MKILIAYASCGAGHFKAAQAVYHYLKGHCPKIQVECVDILDNTPALFRNFYKGSYSFLVRRALLLWGVLFRLTDFWPTAALIRPIGFMIDLFNARRFVNFLIEQQFDGILSTHFFPAEVAAHLKKSGKIHSRLFTLITDFGVHGYWITSGIDRYLVATEATREQLVKKNVPASLIAVSGIPAGGAFERASGADKNRFTVLIGAGSFGIGPIEKLVDLLHKEVQLLVVCASNLRLLETLKRKAHPGVRVFGFVDNMAELMSRSHLIITKAGGMTIAESLSMELVPIFMMAIPGQEAENIEVLSRYGIGIYSTDPWSVKDLVLEFKQHPEKLELIRENIRKIKHSDTLKEICRVVCESGPGCSC
jgi:processive 1,2-diacylglycerol beta-glucosyltransferase